jgi:membrane associated rhomboid family serine protease
MGTYYPPPYGSRFRWSSFLTPAIKALLIANTAVFFLQILVRLFLGRGAEFVLIQWFGLTPRAVTHGLRIWQPFTYLFLHGGLWHLLLNMLVLWMFGSDLERYWGRRRFYFYFFLTGVGAGLINIAVKTISDFTGSGAALIPTIGASGAVYGILLAAALVFPDRQVWIIPFPVTLPMRVYVLIIGAIAFFGSLGASGDNISHASHLGGMLVGYLYLRRGTFLYGLRNRYSDWKRRRLRHKFDVYLREHGDEPPSRPDRWIN